MNRFVLVILFALNLVARAQEVDMDSLDGPKLAAALCAAAPEEGSIIHGTLHIRAGSLRTNVPVTCKVETGSPWRTIYDTTLDHLAIVHVTNGPNQYFYATNSSPTNEVAPLSANIPLAGSDFSLAELGLDFLHWPTQTKLKGEMRLGQPCFVLESSNNVAPGYVRVRSYIDKASGGIIEAEAFDANARKVKTFSLHGSFFRKVHGQWRLEKMEMDDNRKGTRTIIQFDLQD